MKHLKQTDLSTIDQDHDALPAAHNPDDPQGACRSRVVTVLETVDNSVAGQWDVPEFQREFVWNPAQVCALADSLWRNYPIGPLLLWRTQKSYQSEPPLWIADGQQRLTSLCLLYGCEPSWFRRKSQRFRTRVQQRFDIRFDVSARSGPRFVAAHPHRADADPNLIPTARLVAIDPASRNGGRELERLVRELKDAAHCPELNEAEIYRRLTRVSMMRHCEIVVTVVDHPRREDVLEIFARLNSRGMRFRRLLLKLAMEEIPAAIRGMKGRGQL